MLGSEVMGVSKLYLKASYNVPCAPAARLSFEIELLQCLQHTMNRHIGGVGKCCPRYSGEWRVFVGELFEVA